MRRREFVALFAGASALAPLAARAQAMPVIGYLHTRGADDAPHLAAAFRRGLRDGGFVEGKDVRIEYRWASGHYDRLAGLAQELVSLPLAVLVAAGGEPATTAAKSVTSTIPIVFAMSGDPIKLGLAASYNRPGSNATGINILTTALEPKRLGLLHDLLPGVANIGFLVDSSYPPAAMQAREVEDAARAIGVQIQVLHANSESEIDSAFDTIAKERIGAIAVAASPSFDTHRDRFIALAARIAVPAMYHFGEYAAAGGLVSYGIDIKDVHRQLGLYAAQILKGAKPADLPILQPTKFELVINLRTAKTLGLTIPPGVLAIADEVIE